MDKLKIKKQGVLPAVQTRDLLASIVFLWLQQDGWLHEGSSEHMAELAKRRSEALRDLVEWAIREGVVAEEDVIPF